MQHYVLKHRSEEFRSALWSQLMGRTVAFRVMDHADAWWFTGVVSDDIDDFPYIHDPSTSNSFSGTTHIDDVYDIVVLPH